MARMIADLDAKEYPLRKKAKDELAALGRMAEGPLRKTLTQQPPIEVRRTVDELLERLAGQALAPHHLRILRAIEALERIGSPAAQEVLKKIAQEGSPEIATTREAKASLHRLAAARRTPLPR
jgi:hypothetical protein